MKTQIGVGILLGRLSELLGPVGESDGLAPKYPEVSTEVDL